MAESSFLSIDVGTGSVRAAVFTSDGKKLAYASCNIKTRNNQPNYYEQSSADIWRATVQCVHAVSQDTRKHHKDQYVIAAVGIDATCSLVVCTDDAEYAPISVTDGAESSEDDDTFNILLWLDRRATQETEYINSSKEEHVQLVRSNFGNIISPENEPPKLLWLLKHKSECIEKGIFFDLADWLAFKLHGNPMLRSTCTVACKWGWGSITNSDGKRTWSATFWDNLGLSALTANDFHKIGTTIVEPGCPLGCLTKEAAEELGLSTTCVVASTMIDAHAGSLWTIGAENQLVREMAPDFWQRVSVIMGTSSCMIMLSAQRMFVPGVWGPFPDAILPSFYVTEGGQSVTGKLLEYTVKAHPAYSKLSDRVGVESIYDELAAMTERVLQKTGQDPAEHIHCLDYHAGNRSPRADPSLQGCITGLTLSTDEFDLASKFRATVQALCYGTKHILEEMSQAGHDIRLITACGGLCKSKMFLTELADCVTIPVVLSSEPDTVLLGAAILGQSAHSLYLRDSHRNIESSDCHSEESITQCLQEFASKMTSVGDTVLPNPARLEYHNRKYAVYKEMYHDYIKYKQIMSTGTIS